MNNGVGRLRFLALGLVCIGAAAHAAIPSTERQVLLNIYTGAGGSSWIHNGGWNNGQGGMGAAGSECGSSNSPAWYGITCDSSNSHVVGINLEQNGLVGTLPDLSALTSLQSFIVAFNNNCSSSSDTNCGLGGAIPSLSALTSLQGFSVEGDQFTGSIPSLSGLTQLVGFDVAGNSLTGSIPSVAGLTSLQGFNASNNSLSGALPSLSGLSSLAVFDVDHNSLTGAIPSLSGLTSLQSFYVFSNQLSGSLPSLSGLTSLTYFNASNNQLTGTIPSLSGLANLATFNVDTNQLSGAMPSLVGLTALTGIDVASNQLTGTVPVVPNPNNLQPGASTLCGGNSFTVSPDANWDAATGTSPWYLYCAVTVATINLNQHGLTGSWGRSNTPGTRQGFLFNFYPDNIATGHGTVFAGWYTFDVVGGDGGGRWYALQGDIYSNSSSASLGIYTGANGNLNSGSNPTSSQVGTATLSFSSCTTGMLVYAFNDGRAGSIPLSRVTNSTATCGTSGDTGADAQNYLLSGAWVVPNAVGMGFVIDVSPADKTLLGSWYTYFPASDSAPSPRQQWFVFQDSNFAPTQTSSSNIALLQASGGTFDATDGGGVTVTTTGSVSLNFTSCTTATFTYAISTESVAQNTVNLVRLGPAPAGCTLP